MESYEVIMGWKHIDNLHMGPPSTNERVENVDEVNSMKEVIESNIETKDKNVGRKQSYADILIHRNIIRHGVGTESCRDHQYSGQRTSDIN